MAKSKLKSIQLGENVFVIENILCIVSDLRLLGHTVKDMMWQRTTKSSGNYQQK